MTEGIRMTLTAAEKWVQEAERLTCPKEVYWCDGSDEEWDRLTARMLSDGTLLSLNPSKYPNSFFHRSHPSDVARTEHLTFICSDGRLAAGPTNNWMDPREAKQKVGKLFEGSMRGKTMYVIPYLMGPAGSPYSKLGIEVTDSPYVVVNMRIMTRMGKVARDLFKPQSDFCAGLHALGDLSPDRRYILHFPKEKLIWSVGSGYGGNALLGKKCFALRIASSMGAQEGWLAEHMLIIGVEEPSGEVTYMAAAFPSACGKTNLAMMRPPDVPKGYRVWTLGDDIAWMRVGPDGRLWAINPEAGFFGVATGTSFRTNPNAFLSLQKNSIFTNVALTPDRCPWWEGMDDPMPRGTVDWQGNPVTNGCGPAAHPNARFTAPARQCPCISPRWEDPQGVPISAIIFGGRRVGTVPLALQAFSWNHGVFLGAGMASETTAAATGQVGVLRRDPMAMRPFCGYNMGDYFGHWLSIGRKIPKQPAIFQVNWFRRGPDGKFLWPGFGDNLRVLRWMIDRVRGRPGTARETEIGLVPDLSAIDFDGLNLSSAAVESLFSVNRDEWKTELEQQQEFFDTFQDRLPAGIRQEHQALAGRLRE